MGYISYENLQPADEPCPPAVALSGSQLVGGRKATDLTSAIQIHRNEDGELIFGAEIPIQATSRRRAVKMRSGAELSWIRLEFKTERANQEIARNSFLVLTEHPRSSFWWQGARFRPPSHKSQDELRRDDPENWETENADEILDRLESLPYDPWETDRRYLTAGISRPAPAMVDYRTREPRVSMYQSFGVTGLEPNLLTEALLSGREARRLLAATKNKTIKFWPKSASTKMRKLLRETIDDAQTLLHWAILQALAGPRSESERWVERPVMELAGRIYCDHLYNRNRRYRRQKVTTRFDERLHTPRE